MKSMAIIVIYFLTQEKYSLFNKKDSTIKRLCNREWIIKSTYKLWEKKKIEIF